MTTENPSANGPKSGQVTNSTVMLLIAAGRAAQRRFEDALAEHGLTLRHLSALGHLAHTPGLSYSELARRAGITTQSMHATIALLVEQGAVEVPPTDPGRRAEPMLTEQGRQLLHTAGRIAQGIDREFPIDAAIMGDLRLTLLDIAGLSPTIRTIR
ncbi:MarR family winged helix-turn-helix transcriptional regulator [Streptomyces sp. NPDC057199]|uniref:MarR family winged helix-turn-helix transcriptional regulator n=1 Tax=Streptomyces sp. NPDC057199 TaxID=3346047 RepID=UPI00362EED11